jgi:3-hydroxyanthranilate 3,4-dioxygenase
MRGVNDRKKTLNVFKDARGARGSYDDVAVGPDGTDPMPHLSRNRVPQPFYLVSEADQVIVQMAGRGTIHFQDIADKTMALEPGDTVYVPACVPHRLVPHGENVQIRLKAEPPVREAVAWYCPYCAVAVRAIDIAAGAGTRAYLAAVQAFNAGGRCCPACGMEHPVVELGDIAWPEASDEQ